MVKKETKIEEQKEPLEISEESGKEIKKFAKSGVKKSVKKSPEKSADINDGEKDLKTKYYEAVGRRKTATARVRLYTKGNEVTINGKEYKKYFPTEDIFSIIESPLIKMKSFGRFAVSIKVSGGGKKGQAEAIRHGISRALVLFNADFRKRLKKSGYLKRDPRMKERKKFGLRRARRSPQWSKR